MDFESLARDAYAAPREEFIASRDEAVKAAKAEGDGKLATRLQGLRKPTVAAWLVNLLAREYPEDVAELKRLGDDLRQAHADLAGDRLRTLSRERNELLRSLDSRIRDLAGDAGVGVGDSVSREVHDTLEAAVSDAEAARAVGEGRLSTALSTADAQQWFTGEPGTFETQGKAGADKTGPGRTSGKATRKEPEGRVTTSKGKPPDVRDAGGRTARKRATGGDAATRADASAAERRRAEERRAGEQRRQRAEAQDAAADAASSLKDAEARSAEAERRHQEAVDAVDDLRARLDEAERAQTEARREATAARKEAERAGRAHAAARARLERLD